MQRITVELPEPIFQQLVRVAQATDQPLEEIAAQSILSNLPPSADYAPPEMQAQLLQMQTLSIQELTKIAQATTTPDQQVYHATLLEKNASGTITLEERQELNQLRGDVDQLMLQKAYAWAVLRWRGYRIPSLDELPAE